MNSISFRRKHTFSLLFLIAMLLAGCGYVFQPPFPSSLDHPPTGTPSPAAIFCQEQGGSLDMRQYPDFSWYGVCVFGDDSECEVSQFYDGVCLPEQQSEARPIPSDTFITLERTVCLTPCPVYRLSVDAKGNVIFEGIAHVKMTGVHHGQISTDDVWKLLKAFKEARYFQKSNSYTGGATCGTNIYTSLTINGRTKKIKRYTGSFAPPELEKLELFIDKITNSSQWID